MIRIAHVITAYTARAALDWPGGVGNGAGNARMGEVAEGWQLSDARSLVGVPEAEVICRHECILRQMRAGKIGAKTLNKPGWAERAWPRQAPPCLPMRGCRRQRHARSWARQARPCLAQPVHRIHAVVIGTVLAASSFVLISRGRCMKPFELD
jgi:hypothetical protein